MFLALKEIKHYKLRYGLIVTMIVLISYLIFILTSLAVGLSTQNTKAIDSWKPQRIVLNKDSNINISRSVITKEQGKNLKINPKQDAYVGNTPVVSSAKDRSRVSAQFVGIDPHQYIYQNLKLTAGHKAHKNHQVVVDTQFQQNGYHLGDKIKLNSDSKSYQIVGFTKNAKLSVAPVIYGSMDDWRQLHNLTSDFLCSAVISKNTDYQAHNSDLHSYSAKKVIDELPGYQAQNSTFMFMIAFLMIISLIVIAVFLYILTMQKLENYAVLRAQGIPAGVLVRATLFQTFILVISGIVIGVVLTLLTTVALGNSVPVACDPLIMSATVVGLIVTSMLGALIPSIMILKVDPADAIGG